MSQTYLARDAQRPGQPTCVVKRLQPPSIEPDQLQLARRLFNTEADVLHQLGTHEQIPQLLAYFEEAGEFYLIQEYIDGILLFDNLKTGQRWSESDVIQFLEDVLNLLCFVHDRGAIHRDIKPGNLIQRPDGKWVLLDFGAVKQVHLTQLQAGRDISITVAIGTPGYLAPESICGKPRFSSDIFSLGVVAICALTGLSPDAIQDPNSEDWRERCPDISARLKTILERMTQLNFALRYTTAQQVLTDLTTSDLAGIGKSTASIPATILASATIPPTVYMRRYVTQTFKHLAPLAQTIPAIQNLRKTRQLVGVGLCVGLSLGGLHQLARASQTRARAQLDTLTAAAQAADHSTCIETAQAISPFSPIHSDARDILGNCQLAHARQQAQSGHMRDAIATAHQVSQGAPAYDAAQADIQTWSDRILELAAARYRQGEFDTAIAMADAIPIYSPTRSTARRTIGDWRREWQRDERRYQQAQQAFERGEWDNAIAATEEISSPYWRTQSASIVQQSNARLQPAPQPAPAQPAPVPESAPVAVSAPPPAPQPQAAATPTTPQSVENQQQGWIQIQRNIERVQRQQVRVQQERVRRGRDDDDWEDDDWDDDDDDNRQSVRAQSNRRNRNRNSQNRNVTLEDRVVNELETQIRRGVEGLLN